MSSVPELGIEAPRTFSTSFERNSDELLEIRLILRAIHKCRKTVGRDGRVIVQISCGQHTTRRELGFEGMGEEDEVAEILELLLIIHQEVTSAGKGGIAINVTVSI